MDGTKEDFRELEEYADSHRLSKKEWEAYENSLWIARDNLACMAAAESEARAEGMAKGRAEGRAEGSNEANINAAQRMLADGMSKELVMKYTGLSPEQISKIN